MKSAGVRVTPGPSQRKSRVPVTPVGRVTEQVRVTVSPTMTEEEGEVVREMMAGSVEILSESQLTFCGNIIRESVDFLCWDGLDMPISLEHIWNRPELLNTRLIVI